MKVTVTSGESCYDKDGPHGWQINQNETVVAFYNRTLKTDPLQAEISDASLMIEDLTITFHRTIRVPDNGDVNYLPPGVGSFPLYNIAEFAGVLPQDMVEKGGVFFPMYQREAMWIKFNSYSKFALRIYVGGVNAITGEPMVPDMSTLLRRQNGIEKKQDYVVLPSQPWLDGIATSPGIVKQFVAVPYKSGYSVEHQITGRETVGGIQFEVIPSFQNKTPFVADAFKTPMEQGLRPGTFLEPRPLQLAIRRGKTISLPFDSSCTVEKVKSFVEEKEGFPANQQQIFYMGEQLKNGEMLSDYNIQPGSTLDVVVGLKAGERVYPRLCGGYSGVSERQMSFAAGGSIKQNIDKDTNNPRIWNCDRAKIFNVQVLNSVHFEELTRMAAPATPISIATYAESGQPFFDVYNEAPSSGLHGAFEQVKTVAQLDSIQGGLSASDAPYDMDDPDACLQRCRCRKNLVDSILRPCNHAMCNVCAQKGVIKKCPVPVCRKKVLRVVGISAPMGAPGMEDNPKLPVVLLDVNTIGYRREPFVSVVRDNNQPPRRS